MDNRRFIPTDIGKIVNRFPLLHFNQYVQYNFTADMEDELDAVSRGEEEWVTPLEKFWTPFIKQVETIEKTVSRDEVAQAREIGKDPKSGKPMTVRMGRFGPSCRSAPRMTRRSPSLQACVRARRWTPSPSSRRWSCSSCRAPSGRRRR